MRRHSNPRSARRPDAGVRLALATLLGGLILAGCAGVQPVKPVGPLRPPKPNVVADDGELTIGWETQPNASGYTLYWSKTPNPTRAKAIKLGDFRKPPYTHSGLVNGQEVYYLLIAVNQSGESKPTSFRAKPLKQSVLKFDKHIAVIVQPTDTFSSLAARFLDDPRKGWMIRDYNQLDALTPYQAVTVPLQQWKMGGLEAGDSQTVPVLTYHQFSTDGTANRMTVPASKFEAQMRFLLDNDYQVVSLDQFFDFLEFKTQLPERAVVITADDGWKSFYEIAYPILKKYGYPATLFVYTDFPESDELALTWPMIKEMAKNGVDVECHTKSHRNLRMKRGEDFKAYLKTLEDEIKGEQSDMKRKAGLTCRYLAYPYGGRNPLVTALTQKYGFRAAFTVTRGSNTFFTQDFLVRRSMIYGEYSLKEFENNLKVVAELK
jgi:peptidoglycan/xylan/chitin deacetylase (PgdA/CDA1 family)